MFKSPVTRKRSNATQEDVTTVEKVHIRHDVGTDSKIVAKKERRSREKIIEAKGCIVPDENFRTGHRARKVHGEGVRKTKLRKRDRKNTMNLELPVHPGLKMHMKFSWVIRKQRRFKKPYS